MHLRTDWDERSDGVPKERSVAACQLALRGPDAAKACGVCEKSLYLAVRRGELRCVKIGRAVRYRLEDLRAWIDSKVR